MRMGQPKQFRRLLAAGAAAAAGLAASHRAAAATVLVNSLADATVSQDATTGTTEYAVEFTTGSTAAAAVSASLLLEEASAGTSTLALYADTATANASSGGLIPSTLLAIFTSPTAYDTTGLAAATYNLSGYTLAANTNYWLVLKANSGEFDWAWTGDETDNNADSTDAGVTFFGYPDGSTYQFSVATGTAAVPEPASAAAVAVGLLAAGRRRRRSAR